MVAALGVTGEEKFMGVAHERRVDSFGTIGVDFVGTLGGQWRLGKVKVFDPKEQREKVQIGYGEYDLAISGYYVRGLGL